MHSSEEYGDGNDAMKNRVAEPRNERKLLQISSKIRFEMLMLTYKAITHLRPYVIIDKYWNIRWIRYRM